MEATDRPPLDPARLAAAGLTGPGGLRVELLDRVGSTNALAADRARGGAPEGLVVVAEHQTAGRGRLDRAWHSPPGSALTLSMLLRPTVPPPRWPWLPLLTGLEVDRTLRGLGYASTVKWPNDVLVDGAKVAGILTEVVATGATGGTGGTDSSTGRAAVVGIGVNVAMTAAELPVPGATSLLLAGGAGALPDRTELLVLVLRAVWSGYHSWQTGGAPAAARLAASYAEACATVGRQVRVERPAAAALVGRASAVDDAGRLVVTTAEGDTAVSVGDVVHVRPV